MHTWMEFNYVEKEYNNEVDSENSEWNQSLSYCNDVWPYAEKPIIRNVIIKMIVFDVSM